MTAWATVTAAVAPLLAEPSVASGQISQQLAGQVVEIVREQGDWLRARGEDGYEGWIHRGYITPLKKSPARPVRQEMRVSLGCVTAVPGSRGTLRALPLRALLDLHETVHAGEAIDGAQRALRFPTHASAITESALTYYTGTSYVWGGVTPWGADCSGLVQSVFSLHGVQLPRDAWMQAESGLDNGRDLLSAEMGDLLFFTDATDGEVTHVGLALGNARMVHLALARGGFFVERLDDPRDEYVAKLRDRFLFSRSVI
jgi:hypothetical protein